MMEYLKKPVILLILNCCLTVLQVNARLGSHKKEAYYGKEKQYLRNPNVEEKFSTLISMSTINYVIPLISSEFGDLIFKSPKNYSAIVLITDEEIQCENCDDALAELNIVAGNYISMNIEADRELFFIHLDYYDASAIYDHEQIKIDRSSPSILYFPTDSNFENIQKMDLRKYSPSAHGITTWIRDLTGIIVRLPQMENEDSKFSNLFMFLGLLFLSIQRWNTFKKFLVLESVPVLLVLMVIAFTSGQVYNHVHGAPFALKGYDGGLIIIHHNAHSQTVVESLIIFALISTAVFGLIKLIDPFIIEKQSKSLVVIPTATNPEVSSNADQWSEMLGAACYIGAVYGLLFMSNLKMG